MENKTQTLLKLWLEARTRFSKQLEALTESDLRKSWAIRPIQLGF